MTEQSATSDEIDEWNENNDEPHPVFEVEHRPERITFGSERAPFDAKPLSAEEYKTLLSGTPALVLRVSDGTGDGTFRFWVGNNNELVWRCLNWGSPQSASLTDLSACLDDDITTQLLIERDGDSSEEQ